jgi:hypothetical protein
MVGSYDPIGEELVIGEGLDYEPDTAEGELPQIIAGNVLRNPIAAGWRSAGSLSSGEDITAEFEPVKRAYDGWHNLWTRPSIQSTTHYLCFQISASSFNAVCILGHNFEENANTVVTLEQGTDATFGTVTTIAQWTSGFTRRLVALTADLAGVQYVRLKIVTDSQDPPRIGELFIGTNYVLPHRPQSDDVDEDLFETGVGEFEADSGAKILIDLYSGRIVVNESHVLISDEETQIFRDIFAASRYGRDPIIWLRRPDTDPQSAAVLRALSPSGVFEETDANERSAELSFVELDPYVSHEIRGLA